MNQELDSHEVRLLKDLRAERQRYIQGEICSLTWIRARRMIVREAEALGATDKLLALMEPEPEPVESCREPEPEPQQEQDLLEAARNLSGG